MSDNRSSTDVLASLRILNQMGASILSGHTIEQIVEIVYHQVNELMDAWSFAIGVYNPANQRIEYIGARENDIVLPPFSVPAESPERFSGWVFTHKKEVFINDFEKEYARYLSNQIRPFQGVNPASLMYVPILIRQELIGMLSVRTPRKAAYDEQSLELLRTLSVFIAKAIENARAFQRIGRPAAAPPRSYFLNPLSAREVEVLNLLARGATNRAIAAELFVSAATVKTHTLNIYQKLEVGNRTEAIVKAREYGLIP